MIQDSLEEFLLEEISMNRLMIINESGIVDAELIERLWQIMISNKSPIAWRAAWTIWHFTNKRKELMRPYIDKIIKGLLQYKHDGQKREMLKVLQLFDIESLEMGKLLDICYSFLINPKESLAVRVHAMQIIFNISEIEPDLKPELKSTLLFYMPNTSPGFKGRANKLLKEMENI